MTGVPTFPADDRDFSPEVLAHLRRQDRWHERYVGPMPRSWDGSDVADRLLPPRKAATAEDSR